jgi:hypothetical protein
MTNATRDARRGRTILSAIAVGLLGAALVSGPALAGKPSGGGSTTSSSVRVVMTVDRNANGAPNWNDQVTFSLSTSEAKPWVKLDCYQGGAWVSTSTAGFFPEYPWAPTFTLASGGWMSGAGDCTATLYKVTSNGRSRTLATSTFHVDA